jgi:hypothetical protein
MFSSAGGYLHFPLIDVGPDALFPPDAYHFCIINLSLK